MKKVVLAIKCFFFACLATLVYVACNDGENHCQNRLNTIDTVGNPVQDSALASHYQKKFMQHCEARRTDSADHYFELLKDQFGQ